MGRGYYFFRFTLLLNSSHFHFHCLHAPQNVGGGGGNSMIIHEKGLLRENLPPPWCYVPALSLQITASGEFAFIKHIFYPSYGLSFLNFFLCCNNSYDNKDCYLLLFMRIYRIRCSVTCILKSVSKREKKSLIFFFNFSLSGYKTRIRSWFYPKQLQRQRW